MKWSCCLALCVGLAACGDPAPEFAGVAPVRVTVAGSTFDIRVRKRRAEAIRRNVQWAPRLEAVGVPAVMAIEKVSGCRVRRLSGDAARMEARLDCGRGPPPVPPVRELHCDLDLARDDSGFGLVYCAPADAPWPRPP